MTVYWPIFCLLGLSAAVAVTLIGLSHWLGGTRRSAASDTSYECGIEPDQRPDQRIPIHYYRVAMLFILFDVEIAFIYPWAVAYQELKLFGLAEMAVFISLIMAGYAYLWRKGALDWR